MLNGCKNSKKDKHYIEHVFFFQAEDGIRDVAVTGVQTCALPIFSSALHRSQNTGHRSRRMTKLTINDLDLKGKRVFIRVDFNVPLKDAIVTDDTRIRETLPTLRLAIQKGARLVLASHLGRPKGGPDPKYSLRPAAKKLEELLGKPVALDRKSTRLNSSHGYISYAVFCLKKKR